MPASPPPDPHLPDPTSTSTITAAPDLYTALQATRALKEAEAAEKFKFQNSFRGLEPEEAEFLDGILENERRKEREIKEEERRELGGFRRKVEEVERTGVAGTGEEEGIGEVNWRKRKSAGEGKGRGKLAKIIGKKVEREGKGEGSGKGEKEDKDEEKKGVSEPTKSKSPVKATTPTSARNNESTTPPKQEAKPAGLGGLLGDYDSDDSD